MSRKETNYDFECSCDAEKFIVLLKVPSDAVDILNYKNKMSKNLLCIECKEEALEVWRLNMEQNFPVSVSQA